MTVSDLISILQTMPPEAVVVLAAQPYPSRHSPFFAVTSKTLDVFVIAERPAPTAFAAYELEPKYGRMYVGINPSR